MVRLKGIGDFEEGWFLNGVCTWVTGANAGIDGLVRIDRLDGPDRVVELWQETRFSIALGDRLKLYAGCDKTSETCRLKFDNLLNFRGFPQMPGEDWSVAYPVSGKDMDGGSLE